mgnify:CR=1 FL=1
MPRKAKKPCRYPGCPNLTDGAYCDEHRKMNNREYNHTRRDPETAKRYDRNYRKVRAAYAAKHPLCEECLKHGYMVPLDHVHHIVPLKLGGTHSEDNLMSLCRSCHEKKEAELGNSRNAKGAGGS